MRRDRLLKMDYPRLGRYIAAPTPQAYNVPPVWSMLGLPVASQTQGSSGRGGGMLAAPTTPAAPMFRAETPGAPMKRLVPTQLLQGRM